MDGSAGMIVRTKLFLQGCFLGYQNLPSGMVIV